MTSPAGPFFNSRRVAGVLLAVTAVATLIALVVVVVMALSPAGQKTAQTGAGSTTPQSNPASSSNGSSATTTTSAPTTTAAPPTTVPPTTTTAPTTTVPDPKKAAFVRLDAALQIATQGRALVKTLLNERNQGCALRPADAVSQLSTIIANRGSVQQQARDAGSSMPGGLAVADELAQAMQTSIDADNAWSAWFGSTFQNWSNGGCNGSPQTTGDPNWNTFTTQSDQATVLKQAYVAAYNPQAAQYGLKSDWQASDL
jgi:hypothetical protein